MELILREIIIIKIACKLLIIGRIWKLKKILKITFMKTFPN